MLALDGSISPYLPTKEILRAIEAASIGEHSPETLARMLRERLALLHGVTPSRIAVFPQDERRLDRLAWLQPGVPWVVYPPVTQTSGLETNAFETIEVERNLHFRIEAEQIRETPPGSVSLVITPNDPTGNALSATTAAQLGQRSSLLVLDERSAEMQRRSMIPLVEEFDSIVLMRSFSDWAGLGADVPGYAITTNRMAAAIDRSTELETPGLHAALAAVSNASTLDAIAYRVRIERQRLYRMLRKLNFLTPLPSSAGYILARVIRGERDMIARALAERGIAVYAPPQERLLQTLRFSAISPVATRELQDALIAISRTELD